MELLAIIQKLGLYKTALAFVPDSKKHECAQRWFTIPSAQRRKQLRQMGLPEEAIGQAEKSLQQIADGLSDLTVLIATGGDVEPDEGSG